MKEKQFQIKSVGGHDLGQVLSAEGLMDAQAFAHDHVSNVAADFVINAANREIKGFGYQLTGDLQMTISRPGRVYTPDGIPFDQLQDYVLTLEAGDASLPRLDLVVAVLEDGIDANDALIPFVRLRSPDDFAGSVGPYAPTNVSAATEKHWRAVVQVKPGTPAATPQAPTVNSNEVPLYSVMVGLGVTKIAAGNITDLRNELDPLRTVSDRTTQNRIDLANLSSRVIGDENIGAKVLDLSPLYNNHRTLAELIADLLSRATSSRDLPEIRYDNPAYDLTDKRTSQILATGIYDSPNKFIEISMGGRVNFGDSEVQITPQGFVDQTLNPHYVTVGSSAAHTRRDVATTLGSVTPGASDATAGFVAQNAAYGPSGRQGVASAARDSRYIELFGGYDASNNNAFYTDWKTYDTELDTMASRVLTGDVLPGRAFSTMFTMGDGTHVLLAVGGDLTHDAEWFKVNAVTGVVTKLTGSLPTADYFKGDLIAAGKIFILGYQYLTSSDHTDQPHFWEYDVAGNTFTELSVSGASQITFLTNGLSMDGCRYQTNKFILVGNSGDPRSGQLQTFIFDRTLLQWTQITGITAPYENYGGGWVIGFAIANVNNKPMLFGGWDMFRSAPSTAYQFLTTVSPIDGTVSTYWQQNSNAPAPLRYGHRLTSLIGDDGFASGNGFVFGGANAFGLTPTPDILAVEPVGLITASYNSVNGISIAPGSSYAIFEMPAYTADWTVAAYLLNLTGQNLTPATVKVEVSFDNGTTYHVITPGRTFSVTDSDNPGHRKLRFTLYPSPTNPPIITGFTEVLDQDGVSQAESRVAIRYNAPAGTTALYVDRLGQVTVSATIEASTPDKALIFKTIAQSGVTPHTTKSYFNRRRPIIKYTAIRTAGTTPTFSNELAVAPRYIRAVAVAGSGAAIRKIAEPTVAFDDSAVAVADLGTNTDYYIVELFG